MALVVLNNHPLDRRDVFLLHLLTFLTRSTFPVCHSRLHSCTYHHTFSSISGISNPTLSRSGRDLPSSRIVSLFLFPDIQIEDPKFTLAAMQYGQIITHDMSMIAGSTQARELTPTGVAGANADEFIFAEPHSTQCCTNDGQLLPFANIPEHCYPILLPPDDPAFSTTNARCMSFVRTITDRDRNCVGGLQPAEQVTPNPRTKTDFQ